MLWVFVLAWGIPMTDILVPVSGGKDSQACLKLALLHCPREAVRGLYCDTGFEHPLTYAHIETMRQLYGVRIDVVQSGTVEQQLIKHGRFPSDAARFCTEELKIWPTKRYCKALAEEQGSFIARKRDSVARKIAAKLGGFEVWYGMRTGESAARAKRYAGKVGADVYPPHEVLKKYPQYLHKLGVSFRLAVLDWTRSDVMEFLNGEENPLYRVLNEDGTPKFDRVGCFPCQAAGDVHKEKCYQHDDFGRSQYRTIKIISQQIGKPMFNSKGGQARDAASGPGCMLCSI